MVAPTVPTMTMEDVHQGACEKQEVGPAPRHVLPVLTQDIEHGYQGQHRRGNPDRALEEGSLRASGPVAMVMLMVHIGS